MPAEKNKALIQTINKIPFFKGLSPSQAQSIIAICTPKTFDLEEVICEGETESNEMFIFLSGELGVITPDGVQVATILPVTTVGEIGIATRQMRTATVKATKKSNLLVIKRVQLEQTPEIGCGAAGESLPQSHRNPRREDRQRQHPNPRSPRCQGQR